MNGKIEVKYKKARNFLIQNLSVISNTEKNSSDLIFSSVKSQLKKIKEEYNAASDLRPFWKNYPPEDRGRAPRKDQIPWIEVGEHSIGDNILSYLSKKNELKFFGLPTGPDIRFFMNSKILKSKTGGIINGICCLMDIKSVGPRDNFEHTVMSHNQISGDGNWSTKTSGITNSVILAKGKRSSHNFYCSLSPIYVNKNGDVFLSITHFIKPFYTMSNNNEFAQHIKNITIGTIPNGLLLFGSNGILNKYPGIFYPGKDDKSKNPLKVRARIDFSILSKINSWRIKKINF